MEVINEVLEIITQKNEKLRKKIQKVGMLRETWQQKPKGVLGGGGGGGCGNQISESSRSQLEQHEQNLKINLRA